MSSATHGWEVRISAAAEADFEEILLWTVHQFGEAQARAYAAILSATLGELAKGPNIVGAKQRDDILKGIVTLHVARKGRKGRHFVMFRVGRDQDRDVIEVLRVLHDAMALERHLPPA